ncbi:unnamed protein product [Linum trigynum]|uniref:Uncharacterized protein n=1 Tax=Linum trigynum TaxID=586398 RepID=A0AAV2F9Z1_9ROSI
MDRAIQRTSSPVVASIVLQEAPRMNSIAGIGLKQANSTNHDLCIPPLKPEQGDAKNHEWVGAVEEASSQIGTMGEFLEVSGTCGGPQFDSTLRK